MQKRLGLWFLIVGLATVFSCLPICGCVGFNCGLAVAAENTNGSPCHHTEEPAAPKNEPCCKLCLIQRSATLEPDRVLGPEGSSTKIFLPLAVREPLGQSVGTNVPKRSMAEDPPPLFLEQIFFSAYSLHAPPVF